MADKDFESLMRDGEVPLPDGAHQSSDNAGGRASALLPSADADFAGDYDGRGEFFQGGFSAKQLKKLRAEPIDGEIDLHGMILSQAHAELNQFLAEALRLNWRTVEIVHGRGLHSPGQGLLRGKVRGWMAHCGAVLAYVEPRNNTGAIRVRLKKR